MNFFVLLNLLYFSTTLAIPPNYNAQDNIVNLLKNASSCGFSNDNFMKELHLETLCDQPRLSIEEVQYAVENGDSLPLLCMKYYEITSNICSLKELKGDSFKNITSLPRDKNSFENLIKHLRREFKNVNEFCNSSKLFKLKPKNSTISKFKDVNDLFKNYIGQKEMCVRLCSKFNGKNVSDLCSVIVWGHLVYENETTSAPASEMATGLGKPDLLSNNSKNLSSKNDAIVNTKTKSPSNDNYHTNIQKIEAEVTENKKNDGDVNLKTPNYHSEKKAALESHNDISQVLEKNHLKSAEETEHIENSENVHGTSSHDLIETNTDVPKSHLNSSLNANVADKKLQQPELNLGEQPKNNVNENTDNFSKGMENNNNIVNQNEESIKNTETEKSLDVNEKPFVPDSSLDENVNGDGNENNPDNLNQRTDGADQGEDVAMPSPVEKQPPEAVVDGETEIDSPLNSYKRSGSENLMENEDSRFFTYLLPMGFVCGVMYVLFHNKKKILALAVEGRRGRSHGGGRRRPNTASYSKLDSNLEEAMVSNVSQASVTHVLY
ncbi:uncharacterized protein LOC142317266 isoform X2 [Lycorma delicatula]|uniref:uncharacterized protein LOC142317266 isoform X2 n=1 Tax=Lycorma delicatula TaxID=130591 RepID=UPI003F50DB15